MKMEKHICIYKDSYGEKDEREDQCYIFFFLDEFFVTVFHHVLVRDDIRNEIV